MEQVWIGQVLTALAACERELLIFAAFWFVIGLADELAVDLAWLHQMRRGRGSGKVIVLPQGRAA